MSSLLHSMLPLLIKDGLVIAHIALSGLFFLLCVMGWEYLYKTPVSHYIHDPQPGTSLGEARREKERRDREGLIDALAVALVS